MVSANNRQGPPEVPENERQTGQRRANLLGIEPRTRGPENRSTAGLPQCSWLSQMTVPNDPVRFSAAPVEREGITDKRCRCPRWRAPDARIDHRRYWGTMRLGRACRGFLEPARAGGQPQSGSPGDSHIRGLARPALRLAAVGGDAAAARRRSSRPCLLLGRTGPSQTRMMADAVMSL
jgi:hypothetical protein